MGKLSEINILTPINEKRERNVFSIQIKLRYLKIDFNIGILLSILLLTQSENLFKDQRLRIRKILL